jgi:hypothetical protein
MSFDLHVKATNWATGETACTQHDMNYTSNLLPAIRLATGNADAWRNGATSTLNEITDDLYGYIFPTWARNRDAYMRLDPPNGWGTLMSLEHTLKNWIASVDQFRHDDQATVTFLS